MRSFLWISAGLFSFVLSIACVESVVAVTEVPADQLWIPANARLCTPLVTEYVGISGTGMQVETCLLAYRDLFVLTIAQDKSRFLHWIFSFLPNKGRGIVPGFLWAQPGVRQFLVVTDQSGRTNGCNVLGRCSSEVFYERRTGDYVESLVRSEVGFNTRLIKPYKITPIGWACGGGESCADYSIHCNISPHLFMCDFHGLFCRVCRFLSCIRRFSGESVAMENSQPSKEGYDPIEQYAKYAEAIPKYLSLFAAGLLVALSLKLVNYALWNIYYGPLDWRATCAIVAAFFPMLLAIWLLTFGFLRMA
jgi:hypothetical protein